MRKKINTITIILFVVCAIAAVACGWIDDDKIGTGTRTWPYALALTALTLVIGVVRFILLVKVAKNEKDNYVPVRSVNIVPGNELEDGADKQLTDKVVLMHVDNVDSDKVVVRLFKEPVSMIDCAGKVNEH